MPKDSNHDVRFTTSITQAQDIRLAQIRATRPGGTTRNDMIREAVQFFLDAQPDIIGSRAHFHQTFRQRIDELQAHLDARFDSLLQELTNSQEPSSQD